MILVVTGGTLAILKDNLDINLAALYTIHDLAALLILVLIIGHLYLGVILDPQTLRSVFGGKVSSKWLKERHPGA